MNHHITSLCLQVNSHLPVDVCITYVLLTYIFQEARANFTQVWIVFVELLLQCFNKFLLALVDVLNISKDCLQLLLCEHVGSFATLFYIALERSNILQASD